MPVGTTRRIPHSLDGGLRLHSLEVPASFDLILEDESGPDHLLRDFLNSENVFVATDGERAPDHIDDESVPLPAKAIKTLSNSVSC